MLLKIFRGTGPGVMILIFLTTILVWLHALIHPVLPDSMFYNADPMPLYAFMRNLAMKSALGGTLFSFVIVLLLTFLLVSFNTTFFFINERTFLPSVIFVLFTGLFPACQVFNPVLPALLLLLFAIRRIMYAYRKNGTAFNFFDASFLIGLGSLIYANLIWYGLLAFIGIALLRSVSPKELLLSLLGLCTPLAIIAGVYYITGNDMMVLLRTAYFNLFGEAGNYSWSRVTISALAIVAIVALVSMAYLLSVLNGKKIRSRKTFSLLIWVFIISLAVYFAVPSVSVEIIFIPAVPLSYIMTHYFIFSKRKIVPEIFLTSLFLVIALVQILAAL